MNIKKVVYFGIDDGEKWKCVFVLIGGLYDDVI